MIRAFSKTATATLAAATIALGAPRAARASVEVDPAVLYAQMKEAYARGQAQNWNYRAEATYLATIFNAGRAYSLQYPDDPAYGELAQLT
ncbi:MAG TPA: hypothetical protein VMU38_03975, partial [Candidatus Binatia bacterium]|nr:hypothetical protein [Candidatus Binatia bacterium]